MTPALIIHTKYTHMYVMGDAEQKGLPIVSIFLAYFLHIVILLSLGSRTKDVCKHLEQTLEASNHTNNNISDILISSKYSLFRHEKVA